MTYQQLLKKVAKKYRTTPEEVDKEMKIAIQAAGLHLEPQQFIQACCSTLKKTINRK